MGPKGCYAWPHSHSDHSTSRKRSGPALIGKVPTKMPAYKMMTLEITLVNGIMNAAGITGDVTGVQGSLAGSMLNGMNVCVEMMEEEAHDVRAINPRFTWIRIVKVCGPLAGLAQNDFVNLAVAC